MRVMRSIKRYFKEEIVHQGKGVEIMYASKFFSRGSVGANDEFGGGFGEQFLTINYHNFIRNTFEFIIYNFTYGRFHLVLLPRYNCGIFFVFITVRVIFTLKLYHLIVSMMLFERDKSRTLTDSPADLIKNHLLQICLLIKFTALYQ